MLLKRHFDDIFIFIYLSFQVIKINCSIFNFIHRRSSTSSSPKLVSIVWDVIQHPLSCQRQQRSGVLSSECYIPHHQLMRDQVIILKFLCCLWNLFIKVDGLRMFQGTTLDNQTFSINQENDLKLKKDFFPNLHEPEGMLFHLSDERGYSIYLS